MRYKGKELNEEQEMSIMSTTIIALCGYGHNSFSAHDIKVYKKLSNMNESEIEEWYTYIWGFDDGEDDILLEVGDIK